MADAGSAASPGLELIAEEGGTGTLGSEFDAQTSGNHTTILSPGGFAGAPVFDPGETASATLDVLDPSTNRYFSYASMVIPSNDAFFANTDPMAYMIFDASGNFTGRRTIEIRGSDVWDAGTEVNSPSGGAAFSALGGSGVDEGGVVHAHAGLDNFLGTDTAAGTTLGTGISADTLIARINVVPEPASFVLLGMALSLLGCMRVSKRRG